MKWICAAVALLLFPWNPARAGDFRFYVFDETRNERLHYESSQDFTIRGGDGQGLVLSYSTGVQLRGIAQEAFSYETSIGTAPVTKEDFATFLETVRKLDVEAFKNPDSTARADGWINLDGRTIHVSASVKSDIRRQWQTVLDAFLKTHLPADKRQIRKRALQGDRVAAAKLTFAELLAEPAKYDGKRIQLTGYYHFALEDSNLAESRDLLGAYGEIKGMHTHAIWLGESSSFADQDRIGELNDCAVTVEGTFDAGPGGTAGSWPGELNRVTLMKAP